MMKVRKTVISAAALLAAAVASAQNLNPTVVVTNTYERSAEGIDKPAQPIEVPDTVSRFNLDMDYEVQPTPYAGAYEFRPYLVQLRPGARENGEHRLDARLGLGYGFHPEADVVYTPLMAGNARVNLYLRHRSYFGRYRSIGLDGNRLEWDGSSRFNAAESNSRIGADAIWSWSGGQLTADVFYRNIFADDKKTVGSFNSLGARARIQSHPRGSRSWEGGAAILHTGGNDLRENYINLDGKMGMDLLSGKIEIGIGYDVISTSHPAVNGTAGVLNLTPRYLFRLGDFSFNLGVKASITHHSSDTYYKGAPFSLFPDAAVSYEILPDAIVAYAQAGGRNTLNAAGNAMEKSPFLPMFPGLSGLTRECVNARIGVRGNLLERIYYNAAVGYFTQEGRQFWGITEGTGGEILPALTRTKVKALFADVALGWQSESVQLDAHALFHKSWLDDKLHCFELPAASLDLKGMYNWGGRIKAGVTLEGATRQVSDLAIVPGYLDLSLLAEAGVNHYLSAWLKVGNLLGQTIQRIPFYAQDGIYFTIGAHLIF